VIRVENREDFIKYMQQQQIGVLIHYPIPPHRQQALEEYATLQFGVTERIYEQVVSIPISPVLSFAEVFRIIDVINAY
jgi:dTDP-4-amino-4,6-dideoxygalactose transaminase